MEDPGQIPYEWYFPDVYIRNAQNRQSVIIIFKQELRICLQKVEIEMKFSPLNVKISIEMLETGAVAAPEVLLKKEQLY